MIKIAIRRWPSGADSAPLPFDIFSLTRVPCVGEHVTEIEGEGVTASVYRVVRVVHFFKPGDGGRVAEVDAVIDKTRGF